MCTLLALEIGLGVMKSMHRNADGGCRWGCFQSQSEV